MRNKNPSEFGYLHFVIIFAVAPSISQICNCKFVGRSIRNNKSKKRMKIKQKPFRLPFKNFFLRMSVSILPAIFIFFEVSRYRISIFSPAKNEQNLESIQN